MEEGIQVEEAAVEAVRAERLQGGPEHRLTLPANSLPANDKMDLIHFFFFLVGKY